MANQPGGAGDASPIRACTDIGLEQNKEKIMSRLGSLYIKSGEPEGPLSGGCCEVDEWAANEIERLRSAASEVIEFNRQHAHDQYGDANKAESWACVRTLRAVLPNNPEMKFDTK
jgi:hypothetical protein